MENQVEKRIDIGPKGLGTESEPERLRQKKRRLERAAILLAAVAILGLTLLQTYVVRLGAGVPLSQGLLIFILINVNIVLLFVLLVLVLRNLYKIFFEDKQVTRTQLRTKLVIAFVSLSLVPTCLLFYSALQFTSTGHDYWFDQNVEQSLVDSLALAQYASDAEVSYAQSAGDGLRRELLGDGLWRPEKRKELEAFLLERRKQFNLARVEVLGPSGQRAAFSEGGEVNPLTIVPLGPEVFQEAARLDRPWERVEEVAEQDLVRVVWPLWTDARDLAGFLVIWHETLAPVNRKADDVADGLKRYLELKRLHDPIRVSTYIALTIVALLSIFISTWIGFHLAKGITGPIMDLARATERIASEDYDFVLQVKTGAGEIRTLVDAFGRMTRDLKAGKKALTAKNEELTLRNRELDQRRRYMEIVLGNVAAGVLSADAEGRIATVNRSAVEILRLGSQDPVNLPLSAILPPDQQNVIEDLIRSARHSLRGVAERQVRLRVNETSLSLHLLLTLLRDEEGQDLGSVMVVDDLTELEKAQRMAAWREVARRIAHEIKNPLTPIQLATQRLRKRYADRLGGDGQLFDECTQMIVRQVEDLKTLVNEFSNFARMPEANPAPADLAGIVEEAVLLYSQSQKSIHFVTLKDPDVPRFNLDREQIKRALINLLENSVAAIMAGAALADSTSATGDALTADISGPIGRIEVVLRYERVLRMARLEVADDGVGIPPEDKQKLFEPYFSTKRSGTGLGLAIVRTIVADHDGFVRVQDNRPRGTRFIIELPVKT